MTRGVLVISLLFVRWYAAYAQPPNDDFANAIDISGIIGGTSNDAAYTTADATFDQQNGSCFSSDGYNVWFSFEAPASGFIGVTVNRGGIKGDIAYVNLAIWDSDGTTQVACSRYINSSDDVVVPASGLTFGETYYVSVDNRYATGRGSFTLELTDTPDYDFYEGAIDVTGIIGSSSLDAEYTTVWATSDLNPGSCFSSDGYNRWFSFEAPVSGFIGATLNRGGVKGDIAYANLAIWETNGTTEVACSRYINASDDVVVQASGLTSGATYYISVDNKYGAGRGSFTLELTDTPDYDFYEGAIDVTGIIGSSSLDAEYTTEGATSDLNPGSCFSSDGYNRWFSFDAPASGFIGVTLNRGSVKGDIAYANLAIWESNGTTEVACSRYINASDDVVVQASGLTSGATYYISVDNKYGAGRGSFTLELIGTPDYDFYEGAIDITGIIGGSSLDAEYTTEGATSDLNPGSCFSSDGYNRWFSFDAPASGFIGVTLNRGGVKGDIAYANLAIWESNGTTEVACSRYINASDDVVVQASGLTSGATYYISVDNKYGAGRGSFTLELADTPDYDFYEGAFEISDTNNWCSADAQFTTVGATSDSNQGSCFSSDGYNRWFTFTAQTDGISVTVDRGGSKGNLAYANVALWESNGTTEITCKRYVNAGDDITVESLGLTPGNDYYISVDNEHGGGRGTFTLCVDNSSTYDFYEGAYEITNLNNWVSADAEFTTEGATSDQNSGSCFSSDGYNRWFKFTAQHSDATIDLDRGGTKGDLAYANMALWKSDGITEIACTRYASFGDDLSISVTTLVPGNDYYISVDNRYGGGRGTFTLALTNIDGAYFSRQAGPWTDSDTWSNVAIGGAAASDYPQQGDIVYLSDYAVTITTNQQISELNMDVSGGSLGLIVDDAILDVEGAFNLTNSGNNFDCNLSIINGGTINVMDDMTLTRSGGANAFGIDISEASTLNISGDFIINSTGGSVNNNLITLSNTAFLDVAGQTTFSTLSGIKTQLTLNNSSVFTTAEDIIFTADGVDLIEIEINADGVLNLGSTITRGTPAYGILDCKDNATVNFNSAENLQVWPEVAGESTDGFNYVNVTINNSRATTPQVTLEGDVGVSGTLTLTDGNVGTSASALLTLLNGATLSGGGQDSFVDGPLENIGNESFEFPVGDGDVWAPIEVSGLAGGDATTSFTAEYVHAPLGNLNIELPDGSGEDLNHVSAVEYWNLDVSGSLTSSNVTLHWKDASRSGIGNYADLRVAHFDAVDSEWENYGVDAVNSTDPGSITVNNVTSFSPFTLGSTTTANPLPVELAYFNGFRENDIITLKWATYSEINNDHFQLARSVDGKSFSDIAWINGNGNTNEFSEYTFHFDTNLDQTLYFKLAQVDFDGTVEELGIIAVDADYEDSGKIGIYPNPSDGQLVNISLPGRIAFTRISIINISGQNLYDSYIADPARELRLSTNLMAGIYLVLVTTPDHIYSQHLIVK